MPIDVQCACGARFEVPESSAGHRVTCPTCAGRVNVPGAVPGADPDDPSLSPIGSNAGTPAADSVEAPTRKGGGVGILIAFLLFIAVAGAVVAASLVGGGGLPGRTDELQYLPEDTQVVLSLDTARIRAHPVLGPLMEREAGELTEEAIPAEKVGIAPAQVERLLVGVRLDEGAFAESAAPDAEAVRGVMLCLRSNTDIDEEELERNLREGAETVTETRIAGRTVYLSPLPDAPETSPIRTVGVTTIEPRVLLAGAEPSLRSVLEENSRVRDNPAVAALLGRVEGGSYAWAVAELPEALGQAMPSPVPIRTLRTAVVQVRGEDPVVAEARLAFGEAQEAVQVNGVLNVLLMSAAQNPAMQGIAVTSVVEESELVLRVEASAESLRQLIEREEPSAP